MVNGDSKLLLGDCLEIIKTIETQSVDMVLADLPYGVTNNKWDTCINVNKLWEQLDRVCKKNSAVCLFGIEPFSSLLRISNLKNYRYDFIWIKDRPTGFLNAKKRPLVSHETISVFYKHQPTYNPQKWESKPMNTVTISNSKSCNYGEFIKTKNVNNRDTHRLPLSYLKMNTVNGQSKEKCRHPTQKPVPLLEYLIKTYTNEGDTVLDPTMGSGSTGVACKNLSRRFIGIEKEEKYFNISTERINGKRRTISDSRYDAR